MERIFVTILRFPKIENRLWFVRQDLQQAWYVEKGLADLRALTSSSLPMTSSVSKCRTLRDSVFSFACGAVEAPMMTNVMLSFRRHHAIESWADAQPIW